MCTKLGRRAEAPEALESGSAAVQKAGRVSMRAGYRKAVTLTGAFPPAVGPRRQK